MILENVNIIIILNNNHQKRLFEPVILNLRNSDRKTNLKELFTFKKNFC